jgi:hypothetical protein
MTQRKHDMNRDCLVAEVRRLSAALRVARAELAAIVARDGRSDSACSDYAWALLAVNEARTWVAHARYRLCVWETMAAVNDFGGPHAIKQARAGRRGRRARAPKEGQ